VKTVKKLSIVIALALAAFATGCHPAARLDAPNDFAQLGKGSDYDFRAASAHGVVLAVRSESNEPRASVEFWADAIDQRLARDGYAREGVKDVATDRGVHGRQLRYAKNDEGRVYRYWLTVFASDARVVIVEAGGDSESFDPAVKTVERAVLSVTVD
jgi:hypothetical protein